MTDRVRADAARLLTAILLWGVGVAAAASLGAYQAVPPMAIGPLIVIGVMVPFVVYLRTERFRAVIEAIGLRWLTLFHVWRIGAGILFLLFLEADRLPHAFARNAGWGDIAAGVLAVVVTLLPWSRARYFAFHLFGLLDLVDALAYGITFTLAADPRMAAIRELPMALIPLFGVGVTGASHLIAFDLLRRRAGIPLKPALT